MISFCLKNYLMSFPNNSFEIKILMTDMSHNFHNAISENFGANYNWLWCSFHVIRAFKIKLNTLVKYSNLRAIIKGNFLISIIFSTELNKFCKYICNKHINFYTYFHRVFVTSIPQWSLTHRFLSRLNTNCFAEAILYLK